MKENANRAKEEADKYQKLYNEEREKTVKYEIMIQDRDKEIERLKNLVAQL